MVCFIEIKLIIFHARTHAATVSYTFTRYYLSKVSWLWNTLSKLKVGNVPKPDIMSCGAFFGSQRLPSLSSLSVCPSLKSAAIWELSISFSLSKSLFFSSLHRWAEVSSSRRLKPSALWWNAAINFIVFFNLFKHQLSQIINQFIYRTPKAFHLNVNHLFLLFITLILFINSMAETHNPHPNTISNIPSNKMFYNVFGTITFLYWEYLKHFLHQDWNT